MKYYILNPIFVEAPIQVNRKDTIYQIERKLKNNNTKIGEYILIKVDKMLYKLILKENTKGCCKFELISNIYL